MTNWMCSVHQPIHALTQNMLHTTHGAQNSVCFFPRRSCCFFFSLLLLLLLHLLVVVLSFASHCHHRHGSYCVCMCLDVAEWACLCVCVCICCIRTDSLFYLLEYAFSIKSLNSFFFDAEHLQNCIPHGKDASKTQMKSTESETLVHAPN